jgi:hypothetical protein
LEGRGSDGQGNLNTNLINSGLLHFNFLDFKLRLAQGIRSVRMLVVLASLEKRLYPTDRNGFVENRIEYGDDFVRTRLVRATAAAAHF